MFKEYTVVDDLNANATNNMMSVKIKRGIPLPASVMAQEKYEQELKRRMFPVYLVSLVTKKVTGTSKFHRGMEIMGRTVEAAVAANFYGYDLDDVMYGEAYAVANLYEQFSVGWSTERVLHVMNANLERANWWVDDNEGRIRRWMDELG